MGMRGADGAGATDGAGGVPKGRKRRGREPVRPGWSDAQIEELMRLAQLGQSTKAIARALRRSEAAVRQKASRLRISLVPSSVGDGEGQGEAEEPASTTSIDVDRMSREERRALLTRLQIAEARAAVPGAMSLPRGYRRFATGRSPLAVPKQGSHVSVLNPLTSPSVEPQILDRGKLSRREKLPPPAERRGKTWRRLQKEQERERLERHYYERAMTDIRANLFHEVDDILWARRSEFLMHVTEEFALSIAEEVAERDRQYREFWHNNASRWEGLEAPSGDESDPLEALIQAESDEMTKWTLNVEERAAEALRDALDWYSGSQPFPRNREEMIARYRRWMEERREEGEREVSIEVEEE
jgi:hypothetical protein